MGKRTPKTTTIYQLSSSTKKNMTKTTSSIYFKRRTTFRTSWSPLYAEGDELKVAMDDPAPPTSNFEPISIEDS